MAGGMERLATILAVDVQYETKQPWMKFTPDIFINVKIKHDWEDKLTIFGSYKKDLPLEDLKAWGSAFKVKEFFECALNKRNTPVQPDYSIPEEWINDVVGRQIMICSYPTIKLKDNGSPYWNNFDRVAQAGAPSGILKKMVMDSVNKGFIKNYKENDNNGFNQNKTTETTPKAPIEMQLDNIDL